MSAAQPPGPSNSQPGAPYRAALVKRRPAPEPGGSDAPRAAKRPAAPPVPSADERAAEIRAEHARRIKSEIGAVRRIEAMTRAWNDELASTVPAVAAVVSRAVREIVGTAPREDVVATAVRREVSRVRGEHRPVLRVARADGEAWLKRLRERAGTDANGAERDEPLFAVRADDALAPGKCVLEIGARRIDLTPEAQLAAFDDALRNGVGALPPRPAPALPEVEEAGEPIVLPDAAPAAPRAPAARAPSKPRKVQRRSVATAAPASTNDATDERPGPDERDAEARATRAETVPNAPASAEATDDRAERRRGRAEQGKRERAAEPAAPPSAIKAPERSEVTRAALAALERVPSGPVASPTSAPTAPGPVDFDDLDLGDGAARYDAAPAPDAPGAAPWVGAVVSAPDLAEKALGGSRAVAALRQRVARTAGDLRREAGLNAAEASEDENADNAPPAMPPAATLAPREDRTSDGARVFRPPAPDEASGGEEAFPPFAHAAADEGVPTEGTSAPGGGLLGRLRAARPKRDAESNAPRETPNSTRKMTENAGPEAPGSDAAEREPGPVADAGDKESAPDPTAAPSRRDPIATDGGEGVRRAIAGARRRSARPPALAADAPADDTPAATDGADAADGDRASEPGGDRASRLPPRLAKLIAAQRGPRA